MVKHRISLLCIGVLMLTGYTIAFYKENECFGFSCLKKVQCIPNYKFCDGTVDCDDGTDEIHNCVRQTCRADQFKCKTSGKCILFSKRCDGHFNCHDHSDEVACTTENFKCIPSHGKFQCPVSGICIPLTSVCDHSADCQSAKDEGERCSEMCKLKKCDGTCYESPQGPKCNCKQGYQLDSSDNSTCHDIDECRSHLSVNKMRPACSQHCLNNAGSYKCTCDSEYYIANDAMTCIAKDKRHLLIFFANANDVMQYNVENGKTIKLISIGNHIKDLAYDSHSESIYISDEKEISKFNIRTKKITKVITYGLNNQEGIAIDWIQRNLYILNTGSSQIVACSMSGDVCSIIIQEATGSHIRSIVLDPVHNAIYWTDIGKNVGIYYGSMDGHSKGVVVNSDIIMPNGLVIDIPNSRLYWVDARKDSIESCNVDGSQRIIISEEERHPYSIGLFEDNLYWTDWTKPSVLKANKFVGDNFKVLTSTKHSPRGLILYHPALESYSDDVCKGNICSDLCVKSNHLYSCKCPDGKILSSDEHNCIDDKKNGNFLIISNVTNLIRIDPHNIGNKWYSRLNSHALQHVLALAYDFSLYRLYYSDIHFQTISFTNINDFHMGKQLVHDVERVEGIAVDWITGNKYWTDSQKNEIGMFKEVSKDYVHSTILRTGISEPKAIGIDPIHFFLFFSENNLDSSKLFKCSLDAISNCKAIVLHAKLINSMYVDVINKKIYYTDSKAGRVESVNYDSSEHRIIYENKQSIPYAIAYNGVELFWTDIANKDSIFFIQSDSSGTNVRRRELIKGHFTGITNINSMSQPLKDNRCSERGICSYLCIPLNKTIDYHKYKCICPVGSILNEDKSSCQTKEICPTFICDGRCIKSEYICNGVTDCSNGNDENNCHVKECNYNQFECHDRTCISKNFKCDGTNDCNDGSDEINCPNIDKRCTLDEFRCSNKLQCIKEEYVCNNNNDCLDGSDELNCSMHKCKMDKFRCNSGQCISMSWVCDGYNDCKDNDDESGCREQTCKRDEFHCQDGLCISKHKLCDGVKNCDDGSDEHDCGNHCNNDSFYCNKTTCIPNIWKCDGKNDCLNGKDEKHCSNMKSEVKVPTVTVSPCHEFSCVSGECISKSKMCDDHNDCSDASDESYFLCSHKYQDIKKKPVIYKPKHISYDKVGAFCEDNKFSCDYGKCIDLNSVCNKYNDCEDGSDEGGLCGKTCDLKISGCTQLCHETPHGYFCQCKPGYELLSDKKTCIDINECSTGISPCDHECENTKGGYICKCSSGYMLHGSSECKTIDGKAELLFGINGEIRSYNLYSELYGVLQTISNDESAKLIHETIYSLDMLIRNNMIYWNQEDTIYYLNRETNATGILLEKAYSSFIAIDWIASNLYYTSKKDDAIYVCSLKNKLYCSIIQYLPKFSDPRGIVLHPLKGVMFWAHVGINAEIKTSWMDGSQPRTIVNKDISMPNSLTIDFPSSHLYWVDSNLDSIEYCDFNGNNRVKLHHTPLHAYGIGIYNGDIYFSEWSTSSIYKINKRSHKESTLVKKLSYHPTAICFWNKISQPVHEDANHCLNNGCSHICVLHLSGYSCLCPVNKTLSDDQKTCKESNLLPSLDEPRKDTALIPSLLTSTPTSTTTKSSFSVFTKKILWKIQRKNINSNNIPTFKPRIDEKKNNFNIYESNIINPYHKNVDNTISSTIKSNDKAWYIDEHIRDVTMRTKWAKLKSHKISNKWKIANKIEFPETFSPITDIKSKTTLTTTISYVDPTPPTLNKDQSDSWWNFDSIDSINSNVDSLFDKKFESNKVDVFNFDKINKMSVESKISENDLNYDISTKWFEDQFSNPVNIFESKTKEKTDIETNAFGNIFDVKSDFSNVETLPLRNVPTKNIRPVENNEKNCVDCWHGTCKYIEESTSYKCDCEKEFFGEKCDQRELSMIQKKSSRSSWFIWTIFIIFCVMAVTIALYIQYKRKNLLINDLNIRYLRTNFDDKSDSNDEKKSLAYENPGFKNEARRPFCLLKSRSQYDSSESLDDRITSDKKLLV